ncbi:MAG: gamma-glutamylcyclotransferase [Kiritimatiellae bacterium]|nr:gamma-glutamylcyclotransferase [Kiritimatiellia bacterium]
MNERHMRFMHLPPTARARAAKALGLSGPQGEHLVFVYGTLLKGECNERRAPRARRQRAWALGTIYDTGWGFPAFVRDGRTRIKGELLTVDDEAFRSMDILEGCPRLYRRERIRVHLEGGSFRLAWVYIMNRLPESAALIESGDWKAHRRAKGEGR